MVGLRSWRENRAVEREAERLNNAVLNGDMSQARNLLVTDRTLKVVMRDSAKSWIVQMEASAILAERHPDGGYAEKFKVAVRKGTFK